MPDPILYAPVPFLCSAVITSKIDKQETYEISIYSGPMDKFNGTVQATLLYSPGSDGNFKQGTYVKVMVTFSFDLDTGKVVGLYPGGANYIMGTFNERSVANVKVGNPSSDDDPGKLRSLSPGGAGFVSTSRGNAVIATSSSFLRAVFNSRGFGVNKDSYKVHAQNFHRIIATSTDDFLNLSREHFGLFRGSSRDSEKTKNTPESQLMAYRRFVTQTRSPANWVSSCEGNWAPWVGANNNHDEMGAKKEVLLTKIINHGTSRCTIEGGSPGDEFVSVRVDKVALSEKAVPAGSSGATPALPGNLMKINISDKGALDIRSGGSGVSGANTHKFHMSVDVDGNLKIHSAGTIEISHGDADGEINSIKMDPKKGIDITAQNGFRVNKNPVVNSRFLDWMVINKTQLCLVTSIGGPAPISPAALPKFIQGVNATDTLGGFSTKNKGLPATGKILDFDDFITV